MGKSSEKNKKSQSIDKNEKVGEKMKVSRSARGKLSVVEETAPNIKSKKVSSKGSKDDEMMNIQDAMMDIEVQRIMKMQDTKDKRDEAEMQKKLIKYEEVYSIYALVENYPNKFKETLDELVISPDEGESNSDKVILKTVFLYFFELLGVSDDKELKNLVENCLSWTKE